MEYNLIVACDPKGVIGKDGKIPWHFPEDLKFFKDTTANSVVVMGRNTWESIPYTRRPLADRLNLVVSATMAGDDKHGVVNYYFPDYTPMVVLPSMDRLSDVVENQKLYDKVFFIGGASIYKWALENVKLDNIYVTQMDKEYEGDTFIPMSIFEHFPIQGKVGDFEIKPNSLEFFDGYARFCFTRKKGPSPCSI